MEHFDCHTHNDKINSCKSVTCEEFMQISSVLDGQKFSLQFHPWHLPAEYKGLPVEYIEAAKSDMIYALGEIGLDRLRGPSIDVQKAYFKDLLELAYELEKPVLLHVVRCADEVLQMLKKYPELTVIWHGFRGGRELFERLMKQKISVSLNCKMLDNEDFISFLKQNPQYHTQIALESDDSNIDIDEKYRLLEEKLYE